MKCFSLFSGIGGFDLAAQRESHEIVGACEIDRFARQVYTRHFPGVRIWEDATKIRPEELPDFDILCAGFPCQAFSLAGRKLGFEDTRGTLFYEIARIAKEKRPSYLFLENVRGLLFHDEGRTFTTIIKVFYELGYDIEWQVINSKYFVPQNRERIFIIGHLRDKPTQQIFPIRENDTIPTQKQTELSPNVKCLTGGGHSGGLHSQMTILVQKIKYHISSEKQACRVYEIDGISPTLGTGHAMSDPLIKTDKIRRLTPLECERLQSFPDGWTEGLSDTQRFKCIGNAVTVSVVQHIFHQMTVDRTCQP